MYSPLSVSVIEEVAGLNVPVYDMMGVDVSEGSE